MSPSKNMTSKKKKASPYFWPVINSAGGRQQKPDSV